jgi:CheY-like chemotaxis protein
LVDDEAALRAYVARVLQLGGFEVMEAADGVDALAVLRAVGRAVDVLVTDIKMPRMLGTELVEAATRDFPGLPVVYISGEHLKTQLHRPELGIVFLQKPFLPQAMFDAVCGVTQRQSADTSPVSHLAATAGPVKSTT